MNKFPFFNRSTKEYLGTDIYQDTQELTDARDEYESFQEDLRPKTYREKNKVIFLLTNFFRIVFPFLSGITMLGLIIFLAFDIETFLHGKPTLTAWVVGIISLLGSIFLVGINEAVKTRSLFEIFYNKAKQLTSSSGLISRAILTTVVSVVGSAIGIYLITYNISDNSAEIKTRSENIQTAARKSWTDDSLRIVQSFETTISQKQQTLNSFDAQKFRTRRDQLNNEIIRLTQEREDRLKESRQNRDNATSTSISEMISNLQNNDQDASTRGLLALGVIIVLELLNIYCNYFVWQYKSHAVKEGIEFGALEGSADMTTYEVQMQRLGAYLQGQGYLISGQPIAQGNQGSQGVNTPTTPTTPGVNGPRKIGFTQSHEEQKPVNPKPINDQGSDPGLIKKILEELNDLKGQLSQGFLNHSTGQLNDQETDQLVIKKKEVSVSNSHPKFTEKVQPDSYRGIDPVKYKSFIREAKKVLAIEGRYNKTLISKRTGLAKNTVTQYLKVAIEETKDLDA